MGKQISKNLFDREELRVAIKEEYQEVAKNPEKGFHFHTGTRLAKILGYDDSWLKNLPKESIESFAGTGNPFASQKLKPGEKVVDVGCGAGIDSLIAAQMVAPGGDVIGIDMTSPMLEKAKQAAQMAQFKNVDFRLGYGEEIPVEDNWADVIISNGVLNLFPDKMAGLQEMSRVLNENGRLQIADILVQRQVPDDGKQQIDLWTG